MRDLADSLLRAAPLPALVLDLENDRIASLNTAARRFLALEDASPAFSTLLGDSLPRFVVFLDEVAHRKSAWTRDIALTDAKGRARHVEIRASHAPERPGHIDLILLDLDEMDERGKATEAQQGFRQGLSEWKRAQTFFAELERQNQLILNAAGEGIYGLNAEGKTTFLNRAAQEMLGWTADDLLGRDIHPIIHHHHQDGRVYHKHDCPIHRSFRLAQVERVEDDLFWRKDGKPIRVEYVSTPIYDMKVLIGTVVIFRDITERYEGERRLREALTEVAALRDRLEQENAYLQETISTERAHHDIIGSSGPVRQILTRIALVAPTDAPVTITGEGGTGKSLIASAIHKASPRGRRALIHVKCSAHAAETIKSELFGHVRSYALGTSRDQPGKLELAHGGTLFLDDLDELPLDLQGRLLAALQSGRVTRRGDTRSRSLDIRVIAAMNRSVEAEVASGKLREDLALFLNVFPLTCPPLRERREDIPLLADHLLGMTCRRMNRPRPMLTTGAMQRLINYDWPGNVRELQNVIERAVILTTGDKLVLDLGAVGAAEVVGGLVRTEAEMQQMIRQNLISALRESRGRVSGAKGAASLLGLPPTTVASRIATMGITDHDWRSAR